MLLNSLGKQEYRCLFLLNNDDGDDDDDNDGDDENVI
jgi:hypothetical protein